MVLLVMINGLLNSVVRVLLSYGSSHWFKSNSRSLGWGQTYYTSSTPVYNKFLYSPSDY